MFSSGCVFFVALYASTSWPSSGLTTGLPVVTVALGASTIFIRLRIREVSDREAAETVDILRRMRDELDASRVRDEPDEAVVEPAYGAPEHLPLWARTRVALRVITKRAHVVRRQAAEVQRSKRNAAAAG